MKWRLETEYDVNDPSKRVVVAEGVLPPFKDHRGYRFTLGQISSDTRNRHHYDLFLNGEPVDLRYVLYASVAAGLVVTLIPKGEPPTDPRTIINYQTSRITHNGHMRTVVCTAAKHGVVEIKLRPEGA